MQVERENPNSNVNKGVRIEPLHEMLIDSVRTAFLVLYGAVTVLLLVACVNVSNLLVAKASARSREIAIRQALGAGRGRLIRQLLTESILLGILGGILGLILAFWSLDMLQLIAPKIQQTGGGGIPGFEEIRVNLPVLGFTIGLSLIAGLLFGMAGLASRPEQHIKGNGPKCLSRPNSSPHTGYACRCTDRPCNDSANRGGFAN